jgi:PAS domain-containing protein
MKDMQSRSGVVAMSAMSTMIDANWNETVEAIARYRYSAIRHAAKLFNDDGTVRTDAAVPLDRVAGLVASLLEELKVAEEELRSQNAVLLSQRAAAHERTRHYRELFLQSPAPTLVSDIFGTILEANVAAGRLFRRSPDYLVRKSIAAMLPADRRDEFRRQFSHFGLSNEPRDWPLAIARNGDRPLEVCATVQLVAGLGPTASGVLYWIFSNGTSYRVSASEEESSDAR